MYWKKCIYPYRFKAFFGFIFKLGEAILELCVPMVVADLIDHGVTPRNTQYLMSHGWRLFGLATAGYCCALVCQWFASVTSQGFGTIMRSDIYNAINDYDYDQLDQMGTPTLITRITNDVNQMQDLVAMTIRLVSRSPFLIIGSLFAAFMINAQIALIFLVASPLIALSIYLVMSRTQPLYTKIQKILDQVSLITRENLSGVRVIRAFNKQENEINRFNKTVDHQRDKQIHAGNIAALLNPATTIIVNAGIIMILYVSGLKINVGSLTQGEVIALINYMNQILLSMYVFSNVILLYIKGSASYKRIVEVVEKKPSFTPGTKEAPAQYQHMVEFKDVSFSYYESKALTHVSFTVEPHETIGIIGGTGSGKSTVVNLIPRFYEATSGAITFKDQNVKEYRFDALRKSIGIVPQSATLFSGTIRDNLLWGNKNATEEDLEQALEVSQAKEIVDHMKDGLETHIEASGKNVSGGQRQRLTIARALVRKPELLILDDSASALDFATDAKLRRALKGLDTTVIIVSQRVSALRGADKIIVLDHGEVAGIGKHDELLENCTIYKEIVHSQEEGDHHEA
jgi:ATP-binding cassette subfamily B protein